MKVAIYNLQHALDKGAEKYNAREYIQFREASLDNYFQEQHEKEFVELGISLHDDTPQVWLVPIWYFPSWDNYQFLVCIWIYANNILLKKTKMKKKRRSEIVMVIKGKEHEKGKEKEKVQIDSTSENTSVLILLSEERQSFKLKNLFSF